MASTKTKTIVAISAATLGVMIWYLNAPPTDIDGIPISALCAAENEFERGAEFADGFAGYPSAPDDVPEFLANPEKVRIWRDTREEMEAKTIAKFEQSYNHSFDDIWVKWIEYRTKSGFSCNR